MEQPRLIAVDNETMSSATRVTKEGRQLTYQLLVLQQPQRARACGAGAKSSADRRPVDPPPIVELKIYDGQQCSPESDVTFRMNANYFLFATLEQARPMAHGRVAEDKQRLTVLTGTPVAGMVYLDRPNPAGYFIFPDLSVRHEGKYRLSFGLYEELKDVKDDDNAENATRAATPGDPCVTHRLEVKSKPFTVFSAKKFPGLTESTSLSRMVAEQGCRVRIRRDVRMRRRDTKSGKDWDDYEDDTAQARARMSATPDPSSAYPTLPTPHGYGRPRSASDASHRSSANAVSRGTSLQEMNQSFTQPFGSRPHTPQNGYVQSSPYGPSPSQQYQQPPFMQQPTMQPPPPQYSQQPSYHSQPPMPAPSSQQGYYGYTPAPAPLAHPQHTAQNQYENGGRTNADYSSHVSADHRRSSWQYAAAHPPPPPPATFVQQSSAPQYPVHTAPQQAYQPAPSQPSYSTQPSYQPSYGSQEGYGNRAPPPQPIQPPVRSAGAHTPLSGRPSLDRISALPPLHVPSDLSGKLEPSPSYGMPSDSYYSAAAASTDTRKRQHGSHFRQPHHFAPLKQGARPNDTHSGNAHDSAFEADDDANNTNGDTFNAPRMIEYRRATGRIERREMPAHSDE